VLTYQEKDVLKHGKASYQVAGTAHFKKKKIPSPPK